MKTIILLLILCISYKQALKTLDHQCIHDEISSKYPQEPPRQLSQYLHRNLKFSPPARNMVITYDISYFDNNLDPKDIYFKQICEKAIKVAINVFHNLIQIRPKPPGSMKWDLEKDKCNRAKINPQDRITDYNSDLHLYITYIDKLEAGYLAYAIDCRFIDGLGPTHGIVNFNFGKIKKYEYEKNIVFEDIVEIVIHEMMHILGFSTLRYKDWMDSNGQKHSNPITYRTIRGINTPLLSTPNIVKYAKQYYNCQEVTGMPLENQGTEASVGSHWEITIIQNELMVSKSVSTYALFSQFSIELLKDTGFYQSIEELQFTEESFYGRNKGCAFLYDKCEKGREFCSEESNNQCDYYHHGSAQCVGNSYLDEGCLQMVASDNDLRCVNEESSFNSKENQQAFGIYYGGNSRCFNSNLAKEKKNSSFKGNCFKYECVAYDKVAIIVGKESQVCSESTKSIQFKGFVGSVSCPVNIKEFCQYTKYCENNCSSNGICFRGKCVCLEGFKGPACR